MVSTAGEGGENSCRHEELYNGICLPAKWPPRTNFSWQPVEPPYIRSPPPTIDVSLGRQLFVDSFLEASTNATRQYHSGTYHPDNPRIKPAAPGLTAFPFSGGIWWDEDVLLFKLFYSCGGYEDTGMTCLVTSKDGISWDKPRLNSHGTVPPATALDQINLIQSSNRSALCNTVILDHSVAPNSPARYKIAEMHQTPDFEQTYLGRYRLYSSPDGLNWTLQATPSGLAGDRSTVYYNPFRKRWVFSLKYTTGKMESKAHPPVWVGGAGRSRAYWEADDLFTPSPWPTGNGSGTQNGRNAAGVPGIPNFAHTDSADPMLFLNATHGPAVFSGYVPNLYALDVVAYESVLVGHFSILQCKNVEDHTCPGPSPSHEYNSVFVGWSRDGFHWHRPPKGQRVPFAPMDLNSDNYMRANGSAWNAEDVQSSGGGVVFSPGGEKLYIYVSGRNQRMRKLQTGMLSMRRDGYASLDGTAHSRVHLTTRPVRWDKALKFLFVNFNGSVSGLPLRVEVRDTISGAAIAPFTLAQCTGVRGDSTRAHVSWGGAPDGLAAVAGRPVVLHFEWSAGSLFSFWLSESKLCGESRGYAAGGGPGMEGGRDMRGACASADYRS